MAGLPDELVERLYATPPPTFTAARDAAATEARQAGDAATAREITKLRKPTIAAWLVNLLAIRRPDLVAGLVDLAAGLRAAQRELRGEQLRELSTQRRELVNTLVGQARALARQAAPEIAAGKLPLAEVEATLNAALSDVEVAEQVRSGRLIRPVTYAGFGEVPRPKLQLVTGAEPRARPAPPPEKAAPERDIRKRAEAERKEAERVRRAEEAARAAQRRTLAKELANARTRQKEAESASARAAAAEHDAGRALAETEAALADLQRRRAAAEEEVSRRKLARKAAERTAAAARRHTGEVQAAYEAVDAEGG